MRRAWPGLLLALAVLAGGCGGSGDPALKVSAAASLKNAFTDYGQGASYSFAGSDELAAQIRAGAKPDVFASANTALPQQLAAAALVEKPVVFATNRLVVAVPASGSKIASLAGLEEPGTTIAMGSPTVPVGKYTRKVLGQLPPAQAKAILANVRSNEPDVAGVVGKVSQGAVDAGFVYITDVDAARGELRAIALPAALQPKVQYGVAVVKGTTHEAAARKFVDGLLNGSGRAALQKAGFGPP